VLSVDSTLCEVWLTDETDATLAVLTADVTLAALAVELVLSLDVTLAVLSVLLVLLLLSLLLVILATLALVTLTLLSLLTLAVECVLSVLPVLNTLTALEAREKMLSTLWLASSATESAENALVISSAREVDRTEAPESVERNARAVVSGGGVVAGAREAETALASLASIDARLVAAAEADTSLAALASTEAGSVGAAARSSTGELSPPYVYTPSVPSGICDHQSVNQHPNEESSKAHRRPVVRLRQLDNRIFPLAVGGCRVGRVGEVGREGLVRLGVGLALLAVDGHFGDKRN